MIVRSGAVDVVVIDSVAALTPKAEIEGEMGDMHVGLQARLMSQALRKMTANIKNSNTLVIFINQIRMKIGVMFGSPETTTGGNALKFYRFGAARHPPDRRSQGRRRGRRQRDPREGSQEQGGAAVQAGGVPDPLRPGHSPLRGNRRSWRETGHRRQVRRLVQLQRPAHRPGATQRSRVPGRGKRPRAGRSKRACGRSCCRNSGGRPIPAPSRNPRRRDKPPDHGGSGGSGGK